MKTHFNCAIPWSSFDGLLPLLVLSTLSFVALAESPNNQLRGGELQSLAEHQYGKVEVRMYSQQVPGTTSTFFWWRKDGWKCGTQWNEIDIETIPSRGQYQSNPIWQTSNADCDPKRWEGYHGDDSIFGRWVNYTLEWSPDRIAWYSDGRLDREITKGSDKPAVQYIQHPMRYAFNLWSQGHANSAWLGNLDFNALKRHPVYQFVDYFKYYKWMGNQFEDTPTTVIEFTSEQDIHNNFSVSNWDFDQSQGYLSWATDAVGVVELGDGDGALWLGLFYEGEQRAPREYELPGYKQIPACTTK